MKKEFKSKSGKPYFIELGLDRESGATCVNAYANDKLIGYCNFDIKNRVCVLYKIEIVDQEFLAEGVGKCMIKVMEQYAKNKADYIEGKFYPEGIGASRSKAFYENNDYSIEYDDYYHGKAIYKSLYFKKDEPEFTL